MFVFVFFFFNQPGYFSFDKYVFFSSILCKEHAFMHNINTEEMLLKNWEFIKVYVRFARIGLISCAPLSTEATCLLRFE